MSLYGKSIWDKNGGVTVRKYVVKKTVSQINRQS